MSTTARSVAPASRPEDLGAHFLPAMRRRFKSEVNRMTSGAMAALVNAEPDAGDLSFLLSYVYAFHWLRQNVHADYRAAVLSAFRGPSRAFLMDLLERSADTSDFVHGYVRYWLDTHSHSPVQREQMLRLLARSGGDPQKLTQRIVDLWEGLRLFSRTHAEAYRDLGRQERERYAGMLSPEDHERLALVDGLPEQGVAPVRFAKLGLIPAMGCPQTCRHCMFIWRPPMRNVPDPEPLYALVDQHTDSVLFTGGDLTRHLHHFTRAIGSMPHVRTFAILLNGDFADDLQVTDQALKTMAEAVQIRPRHWPAARVLLQISFDEFHQEVLVDKHGVLKERIPVAKIAHIVESAPRYAEIQLCLVHKQTALNFSMDLFGKGVFGRLVRELGRRGHQVQVLDAGPSPRLKRDPLDPDKLRPVLKDASFVLARYPDRPILLTSSTIDAYGRAVLLDEVETVKERDLLHEVLRDGPPPGEAFDTDLMFWFNGWVTLFSAVHICLGDVYREGAEVVLARHRNDPLTAALRSFDRRLLEFYGEVRGDLDARIAAATGPHHLFHSLTEDAAVRLHMTRRLLQCRGAEMQG